MARHLYSYYSYNSKQISWKFSKHNIHDMQVSALENWANIKQLLIDVHDHFSHLSTNILGQLGSLRNNIIIYKSTDTSETPL